MPTRDGGLQPRKPVPTGTASRTRVLIQSTDGKREWGTVGVDDNIIEASLQALVDSMEYALLKK
jgi:2-isopropylmalate synthase